MAVQSSIIKSVRARFASRISQPAVQDEEQLFLASIVHLTPEEQYERLQRRAMYQRMVQRQGIMEVEQYTKL